MADPQLEALWKKAVREWDDEGAHGRFLEHCRNTDQLVEAAVRYRGMSHDRDRGSAARKRLSAVTLLALAQLEACRSPPRTVRRRARAAATLVLVAAAVLAVFAYLGLF